jgi:ATP-binding cassette subfamily B protein
MSEFFDSDEVTKDYDPEIFGRLMRYLKPHAWTIAFALVALALGTAAELFLPVLVRDTVDRYVLARFSSVRVGSAADAAFSGLAPGGADSYPIGDERFIPQSALSSVDEAKRSSWKGSGLLDEGPYYAAPVATLSQEAVAALDGIPGARRSDTAFAMPIESMSALDPTLAVKLRDADIRAIAGKSLAFLATLLVALVATFAQVMLASVVAQRVMKRLRLDLFSKTLGQSIAFLSRHPVGRLVTRLTGDVDTIDQFFTEVVASFLKDAALMIGVLATLFALDATLALFALATIPPVLLATMISRKKARDAFRHQRKSVSRVNAYLAERVSGVSVVQLFAREADCAKEFAVRNEELKKASLGEMYVFATFRPVVDFLSWTTIAVIIWAGASMIGAGNLSLGTLIAFVNLARLFYSPVLDISEKYTMLQSAMAGGERVFKLLDADESIPDPAKGSPVPLVRGRLRFDRVSFGYQEGVDVIRDLSLEVGEGERIAIVGTTGAGKTTLANLVTRMWDVRSGAILLDGVDLRSMPLAAIRTAIQPVPQDVFLFSGTIRENIALGLDLGDDRIMRAAMTVSAHDFIASLPDGYDTVLSEGATNLSSGQRQLVSFARVVAHDPKVVILDEATSAIDTETERLVQAGLEAMLRGRSSIAIAHRLSTIKNADRIVVLAHGRIAEQGTHRELIERRGVYYELYRLQYGAAS